MTTLRVLTGGKPAHPRGKHGYTCPCEPCAVARWALAPAVCQCDRPTTYLDPDTRDHVCLTCGRPSHSPALRHAA